MADDQLIEERLTRSVIGAFYDVYNTLGFGFLEQVYLSALDRELRARGHVVGREVYVPVMYKGEEVARQRIDMIIDERVLVETKSTQELHRSAKRQLYNYLRSTRLQVGLLLHFGPEPCFYRLVSSHAGELKIGRQTSRTNARRSGVENRALPIIRVIVHPLHSRSCN